MSAREELLVALVKELLVILPKIWPAFADRSLIEKLKTVVGE